MTNPPPSREPEKTPPIIQIRLPPRPPVLNWVWVVLAFIVIGNLVAWLLVARVRQRLAQSFEQAEDVGRWYSAITAAGTRLAVLTPTPSGDPELRGCAFHDPESKRTVFVFENLHAPDGESFRLWAIRGDRSKDLGEIRPDEQGHAVIELELAGDSDLLDAFAVSLEAADPSPSPEGPAGPVVLLGALER